MYYVSWIREYPIYEPAEGGYYYAGEQVFLCERFATWKKAKKRYKKLKIEFLDYCDFQKNRTVSIDCGGCGKYVHPLTRLSSKYIGEGEWIQITRREPQECGWHPYE